MARTEFTAEKTLAFETTQFNIPRPTDAAGFLIPTLRVVAGADLLQYCTIYPGEQVILGRDESCELYLQDAMASRHHARITCDLNHTIFVQDLGSTNGTVLNRIRIRPQQCLPLSAGDILEIGATTLRLDRLRKEELAHLVRMARHLDAAKRDSLTGLLTRTYLDEDLPKMLARNDAIGLDTTAVFVDIDHFKRVNDSYGHKVGDAVLKAVAQVVLDEVRNGDPAVRYGGEEFVVLLPNCDETGGLRLAERLRAKVGALDWAALGLPLPRLSVSLGVAQRLESEAWPVWLDRADQALYCAKRSGRDRSVRWSALQATTAVPAPKREAG